MATGRGTQCLSAGELSQGTQVRYTTLIASDLGTCDGKLAYRTIKRDTQTYSACNYT